MKGPLLDSWDAAVTFCQSVPKLAERIIKVSFGQSGGADGFTKYLVMTGLCGYVNHFEGVLSAPNAKLVALPENGLGDHLVYLEAGGTGVLGECRPYVSRPVRSRKVFAIS